MPSFEFDATNYTPQYGGGGMLPIGKHPVMIVETELKSTNKGDGGFLALTMEAVDGPAKGVRHTDRINLHNSNAMAVEIAQKQLSAYCYVTGVFKFKNTDELCKRPFVVEIGPQKNRPEMTDVVAIYTSDMRKPSEVVRAGAAPMVNPAPPTPTFTVPAENASPSNNPWGVQAGAAGPWGAPG